MTQVAEGEIGKMRNNKYSNINELAILGFLANAMGGGGDKGQSFPQSDAEDLSRGLRFIPGEVTLARRRGERIEFIQKCRNQCCWYWKFQDGSRTYYWERGNWEMLKGYHASRVASKIGTDGLMSVAADELSKLPCPACGNPHTSGGHIKTI